MSNFIKKLVKAFKEDHWTRSLILDWNDLLDLMKIKIEEESEQERKDPARSDEKNYRE